jgi:integrase/recombinase XerD
MKTVPTSKGTAPQNFVRELRLRNPLSGQVYRRILNGFQRFVAQRGENQSVSQETVRQWLRDRIRVWPFLKVATCARLVDRFLDWMVHHGTLSHNPLADWRREYGQRTTRPVVRALLTPDFEAALEVLRPAPRFGSFLGPVMGEDVALRQAMGYRYTAQEKQFLRLDRFLQGRPDLSGRPLTVLIREWTNTRSGPQHALECHQTGRNLSRALSRTDPTVENIPWDRRIRQEARLQHRRPYIFSEAEVRCLLATALSLPSPRSPLRPRTVHLMLVLAYCAGLRLGEIVRLNVGDFDPDDRAIEIRGTKFFKSRRLPLSDSVAAALQSYLDARQQAGAPNYPDTALFWHPDAAGRYSCVRARSLLVSVLRRAGVKPGPGHKGPRVHDMRQHADSPIMPNPTRWFFFPARLALVSALF